jgi:nitroreductase
MFKTTLEKINMFLLLYAFKALGLQLEFFDVIMNRRSIRKYEEKSVEKEKLQRILEAARLAPSAMNRQPYKLYVLSDTEILSKINSACNQSWKAPVMIAMVSFPKDGWVRDDGEDYWKVDAAIAINQLSLAAYAEGLGTCLVAAFKESLVKEILELSSDSRVLFLLPLGYPAEEKKSVRNRKTFSSLVSYR